MARGQGLGDARGSRTRDVIIIYILRATGDKEFILYSAFTECLRLSVYMLLLIDSESNGCCLTQHSLLSLQ